ncbi:MAG: glycoside hydrolase family 31 protein [Alphaproteobacteria bacterium]|nr:glycoside hydrolase family 31 protein [Alphaproteobacteria bacterium]MDE2496166.1 glycoside hydrolase family 31 protein [Alphaproteobacteria bacterium]
MRVATLDRPPVFRLAERNGAHLTFASDTAAVAHLFILEEDIVRLAVLPQGQLHHPRSWTLAPGADDAPAEGRDRFDLNGFTCPPFELDASNPDRLVIVTTQIKLTIMFRNLHCRWQMRKDGHWFEAMLDRPTQAYDFGWWGGGVCHYLARAAGEQYFGLGERSGDLDRAGRRFRLSNLDAMGYDAETSDPLYKHIPFYITRKPESGLAFGLFYDTLSDCSFDFGREHSNYHGPYRYFAADHGDLDLYVIAGPSIPDAVRRFTWLTGRPAATPDWALGYSGSAMSYTDAPDAQACMAGFLKDIKTHGIPCTSFHLSSGYTSIGDKRYVFNWNREKFPDPKEFVAGFNGAGVKLIPNIKPVLLQDHPLYREAAERGLLLADANGAVVLEQFWDSPGAYLDFTNSATVDWWKAQVKTKLLSLGIAATWNDNNEYEVRNPTSIAHGFGAPFPAHEMKPLQTLLMLRASRDAEREHAPEQVPFLVTRSGAAGMQRYAQTWSGDNYTSWKTLKWNVPMGLGLALSGVSNIGHDVGGFAGPRPDPELFIRWIGLGVFMPRFSIHSWNEDGSTNEPWMYPALMDDVRKLMELRARLIPYLSDLLARYRSDYEPVVRPIFYDFPDDLAAWSENEMFMLGDAILVAPVLVEGVKTREVRLPAGADWRSGWSGEEFAGGRRIVCPARYDQPLFFIRSASKRPLGDLLDLGYASQ